MLLLVALGCAAWAGEATRAQQEARALAAVMSLAEGPKREVGLKIVRGAWQRFRDDATAAEKPPAEGDSERIVDLRARNAALATLRTLAAEQGAAVAALVEGHLERWPLDDEARTLLGEALLLGGDQDGAWRELEATLTLNPAQPAARELRGRLSLGSSNPEVVAAAITDLAPLVARLLEAGCAAEAANDAPAATRALAALDAVLVAVTTPADLGRLAALRAGAAERAGDTAKALELWRSAATAGVTVPDPAPRLRALVRQLRVADIAPAIAAGDTALLGELSPAFPDHDGLQDRLFRLLLNGGRLVAARDAAKALVAADPTHPLGLLIADGAQAALDPQRLDLLPAVILRVRSEAPVLGLRFPVVYGLDAALTEARGDPAGAARALDPLLAAQPDDRGARWQRARLLLAADDKAGALADCDLLLASSPDDVEVLALRGRVRAANGDQAGALADAERLVVLRPGAASLLGRARIKHALSDQAGVAGDLDALIAAAQTPGDTLLLMDALDLTADEALTRRLLERASQLGNVEATRRLRRMR
jgi:tetratricopeptide (TPR) repeat protein